MPFFRLHRRAYSVYFDIFSELGWEEKKSGYIAEQERQHALERVTVAYAQPGEMQPERDFNYQGPENARITQVEGRPGRRGGSWLSFDLPVESESPMALVVTYYSGERSVRTSFDILVDGQHLSHQEVIRSYPQRFFDVEYAIDASFIKGKEKVTVRFEAEEGSSVTSVFGIRMIRKDKNEQ